MASNTTAPEKGIEKLVGFEKFLHEFRNDEAVFSFSAMKQFMQTPRHFVDYKNKAFKPTQAMNKGTALHYAVFEPEKFETEFCFLDESQKPEPHLDYRNAKNRDWKKEELEKLESTGKLILKSSEGDLILKQRDALWRDAEAKKIIANITEVESWLEWEMFDLKWHGRTDAKGGDFVADLKAVNPLNPSKIRWRGRDDRWVEQLLGYQKATNTKNAYTFCVDEKCHVLVIRWSEAELKAAETNIQHFVNEFWRCYLSNAWDQSHSFHHGILEI